MDNTEHPVDSSEEARVLGEASCDRWLVGFMRWAAYRIDDIELLVMAAYMDGFRAGLKATLPMSKADQAEERRVKWRLDRIARTVKASATDLAKTEGFGR